MIKKIVGFVFWRVLNPLSKKFPEGREMLKASYEKNRDLLEGDE